MKTMDFAPIVLFVYNRLWHTRQTIESLQRNGLAAESELHIYSDAPRNENDRPGVEKVREYIRGIRGFKRVSIVERNENFGVDRSIIAGATEVINRYGKIIVLEDDLELHPQFMEYMNRALEKYRNNGRVFSISGYSFINNREKNIDETYFLKIFSSWTWATWKDRWDLLDPSATGWEELRRNPNLRKDFDFDNAYPYTKMLEAQMKKGVNTWDIIWYWTVFKHNGLTLYPKLSLVRNIGFDGSGVHCSNMGNDNHLSNDEIMLEMPDDISEENKIRRIAVSEIRDKYRHNLYKKILLKLRKIFS